MLHKFCDTESACSGDTENFTLIYTVNTEEVVQSSVLICGFHHYYLVVEFLSLYGTSWMFDHIRGHIHIQITLIALTRLSFLLTKIVQF